MPSGRRRIASLTGLPFVTAPNKFEALATHDALVFVHGALNSVATGLFKIANDIRLLGSGPRSGLGELILPENEPGSSIMPGKVNPTQAEALTMVCCRVFGNQTTVTVAGEPGPFRAQRLQARHHRRHAAIDPPARRRRRLLPRALRERHPGQRARIHDAGTLAHAGHRAGAAHRLRRAAKVAKTAHANGTTLREEALRLGVSAAEFDRVVRPEKMIRPG